MYPMVVFPCNGAEYTRAQFPALYDTYLVGGKFLTCTYAEFSTQVAASGNCAKFAIDTATQKFKVPMLKDGDSITQASSTAELGKSYRLGCQASRAAYTYKAYHTGLRLSRLARCMLVIPAWVTAFHRYLHPMVVLLLGLTLQLVAQFTETLLPSRDEQVRLRHLLLLPLHRITSVFRLVELHGGTGW